MISILAVPESKLSSGREYLLMFMENKVEFPVKVPMEVFIGGLSTESLTPTKVTVSYPVDDNERHTIETYVYSREVHKFEFNHTVMQVIF